MTNRSGLVSESARAHTHTHSTHTITLRACVSYCTCQSVWGQLVRDDRPPTPPRSKKSLRVLLHNNLLVVTWISPQDLTGNTKPGTGNFPPHFSFFFFPNHHHPLTAGFSTERGLGRNRKICPGPRRRQRRRRRRSSSL